MAGDFVLDIERFAKKAGGNMDVVVRKVAFDLFLRVIQKSPVDTGRFKSNWQVAINTIPQGTLSLSKDVSHGVNGNERRRGSQGGRRSSAAGAESIARVSAAAPRFAAGQVIYLVNNLVYARALEYGHSKQAPSGMVRLSVAEYGAVVMKAANEVPK